MVAVIVEEAAFYEVKDHKVQPELSVHRTCIGI